MKTRYLVIHGTADNNEQAIKLCGEALYKAGIVSENFGDLCAKRKGTFPQDFRQKSQRRFPM